MLGRKQEIDLKLNQLFDGIIVAIAFWVSHKLRYDNICLLYTSPSPRDVEESRMPSSA